MIIVSAADEAFAPHFATMMHSAWTHNPSAQFYLLDCGVTPQTQCKLLRFAGAQGMHLDIVKVDLKRFAGLKINKNMSAATYARLFIDEMLPRADRALYLDSDTIILGDLSGLWGAFMGGKMIAGVADSMPRKYRKQERAGPNYINAGVLLIDVAWWRERKLGLELLSYLQHNPDLKLADQTAINHVCERVIRLVPSEYNILLTGNPQHYNPGAVPRILHWAGPWKPWIYTDSALADVYLYHRRQTPFELTQPQRIYRPWWRTAINMALGRPKYWRRYLIRRRLERWLKVRVAESGLRLPQAGQVAERAYQDVLSAGPPAPLHDSAP